MLCWGHLLVFDFLIYCILALIFVLCIFMFEVKAITGNYQAFVAIVAILLIGGLGYIALILLFSFAMDDPARADGIARLLCSLGSAALQVPT